MSRRVPAKYRGFPGPFAAYCPAVAAPSVLVFMVIIVMMLVGAGALWWFTGLPTLLYLPVLAVAPSVNYLSRRRWKHRLSSHDWLLCLHCGYPLERTKPQGRCSECGHGYTHGSSSWGWRVQSGMWTDDMDPPPPLPAKVLER